MAKAAKQDVATLDEQVPNTALALDDDLDFSNYTGTTGAEGIDDKDITIPRLKIGQAISEEVKAGHVREGSLFLNIDARPLWSPGEPPIPIHIIATMKDYVLWRDRMDQDGGVMARATPVRESGRTRYKWDNPNQRFETKLKGVVKAVWETKTYTVEVDLRRGQEPDDPELEDTLASWGTSIPDDPDSPPAATANHTYLVMFPTLGNAIALMTLSRTGVGIARKLNAMIRSGTSDGVPLPMLRFTLSTFVDSSGAQPFMNWAIKADGRLLGSDRKVPDESRPVAKIAMKHFEAYQQGAYTAAAQKTLSDKSTIKDDDIPF